MNSRRVTGLATWGVELRGKVQRSAQFELLTPGPDKPPPQGRHQGQLFHFICFRNSLLSQRKRHAIPPLTILLY